MRCNGINGLQEAMMAAYTYVLVLCLIWRTTWADSAPTASNESTVPSFYPRNYTLSSYLINHPELCRPMDSGAPPTLVLMVTTAANHFDNRATVRQTWGSIARRPDIRLVFLLGATADPEVQDRIYAEDTLNGDLLQEDFLDTYRNLTLKSIMMLRWLNTSCEVLPRWVLKIDDDCFLNTKNLFEFMKSKENDRVDTGAIYGYLFANNPRPHRNNKSKWYMSVREYSPKRYPVFVSGPSYLWRGNVVPKLFDAVFHNQLISLEDVYVNGICGKYAGVPNVHAGGISEALSPMVCKIHKAITIHDLPPVKLQMLWWMTHDSRLREEHCVGKRLRDTVANSVLNSMIKKKEI